MSQVRAPLILGISYQQVQKHESGRGRVSAGTLQTLGMVLGMHPAEFFDETTAPVGGVAELREAMSMASTLQRIASVHVLKRIVALIEELAGPDSAEHDVDQPIVDNN